jgi:hypothetical protein
MISRYRVRANADTPPADAQTARNFAAQKARLAAQSICFQRDRLAPRDDAQRAKTRRAALDRIADAARGSSGLVRYHGGKTVCGAHLIRLVAEFPLPDKAVVSRVSEQLALPLSDESGWMR